VIRAAALCLVLARCAAETYMGATGYWLEVQATAYSPLDAFTRDDIGNPSRRTANGTRTNRVPYGIAADPSYLPYGTRIIVPHGFGYLDRARPMDSAQPEARVFTVDDTGSIITERTRATGLVHLDLRFISVLSAQRFGSKRIAVFVILEPL
jgi:3D (Asp-Asp-Asp) domain-containing protein